MYNPINPKLRSWIVVKADSDFPIQNLPFGIFRTDTQDFHAATRIGDFVIDLHELQIAGYFREIDLPENTFQNEFLNPFISLGKKITHAVRLRLAEIFQDGIDELQSDMETRLKALIGFESVQMTIPVKIGDYTDFYSSEQHAYNVGCMFRDPANALMPNWKHLPVGYHGRASSIVVSGTNIHRPMGQTMPNEAGSPIYGPSKRLDFELEVGFITGKSTQLGDTVSTKEATDYIFGFVLFNDWSARDVQKWEYVPLGPFLAKNFASAVSPWIVTLEALEPYKVPGPVQNPRVLPYLEYTGVWNFDVNLQVYIQPEGDQESLVSNSNFKHMYWNVAQQLAHQTMNGCNINVGDLYASGTISGPTPDSYGSMLELSWGGSKPLSLNNGIERKFIEDGDTVTIRGFAEKDGLRIGFGEVTNKILPPKK